MMKQPERKSADDRQKSGLPDPKTAHERNNATPESSDLDDPAEVWKDPETTPSGTTARKSGGDRVADSGDLVRGAASPYSEEAQADAVARQTRRPKKEG